MILAHVLLCEFDSLEEYMTRFSGAIEDRYNAENVGGVAVHSSHSLVSSPLIVLPARKLGAGAGLVVRPSVGSRYKFCFDIDFEMPLQVEMR